VKPGFQKRVDLGRRALGGEDIGLLAREFRVVRDTIRECATELLYALQDFNSFEYRRVLRTGEFRELECAITYYRTLCEKTAPETPGLVWHFGLRQATIQSLIHAGYSSRAQVSVAYHEGRLESVGHTLPNRVRPTIVAYRIAEIARWLNVVAPSRSMIRDPFSRRVVALVPYWNQGDVISPGPLGS
jgi:hypothetical protein